MVAELFAALIEMISSHLKTYKQTYQTGAWNLNAFSLGKYALKDMFSALCVYWPTVFPDFSAPLSLLEAKCISWWVLRIGEKNQGKDSWLYEPKDHCINVLTSTKGNFLLRKGKTGKITPLSPFPNSKSLWFGLVPCRLIIGQSWGCGSN